MRRFVSCLALLAAPALAGAQSSPSGDWPAYGRDRGGERFSPLDGIDRGNVTRLQVAWEYSTGEAGVMGHSTSFEATPLVSNGVMFLSTPLGKVIALDAETGSERWVTDLGVPRIGFGDFTTRGVALWVDAAARGASSCARRVIVATVER
jgi:quinoprotein glucose dehydrogenase